MSSNDENLNLYGLCIIKDFLSINENNNEKELLILLEQLNEEYLSYLIKLLNKGNNQLSNIVLWILFNLSYFDYSDVIFTLNLDIIYKISLFLGNHKNNKILTYKGLLLLNNITANNMVIKNLFLKYNIFQYFLEVYEKYYLDNRFINKLLMCIGNFIINPCKEYVNQYFLIIKIIKSQINSSTKIIYLNKYIFYIYNLLSYNICEINNEIIKENIFKDLIDIYPFKDFKNKMYNNNNLINDEEKKDKEYLVKMKLLILKTLGKIISLDENGLIAGKIIDYNITDFLNKIIDESANDIKIIRNAAFCISNLCVESYEFINKLYNEGICLKLIKIGENIYKALKYDIEPKEDQIEELNKTFSEICYVLGLIINNSIYEKLLPLVKYNNFIFINFIIEALKIFQNNIQLIDLCLNSLYHLISYDKAIEGYNYSIRISELNVSFSEFMDRNGIKSILENYIINDNKEICKLADKLYNIIYS